MGRMMIAIVVLVSFSIGREASGQSKAKLAREGAEYVLSKFGQKAAAEGVETLARKSELLAARYGDEALTAIRKAGPQTFRIVEDAGEQGGDVVRLLAKYGDDALRVSAKRESVAFCTAYGDDAAEALIQHGEIVEPLLKQFGRSGAMAAQRLSGQNARRLAMMTDDATLTSPELIGVIGRYGDRAMDFVWKHKGVLATASVLAAFVANPEPFLDGTVDLAGHVVTSTLQPVATVPLEIARQTNWNIVIVCTIIASIGWGIWRRNTRMHMKPTRSKRGDFHATPNNNTDAVPILKQ